MHPDLFTLGPLTLHTYGLLVALGLVLAAFLAQRGARALSISQDMFWDLSLWIILGGMAGARLLYVIVCWKDFAHDLLGIFRIWDGGLVFYGGIAGGFLSGWWFIRRHKLPFWELADIIAPTIPLAHVLGRLGCFFAGCCYGREDARLGLIFPALADGIPHLPTQLYEAGFNLLLFGFLWWRRKAQRPAGRLFWMYVMLYAAWRFAIEFLRGDEIRGAFFLPWLHTSQLVAAVAIILAAFFWIYLGKRARRT
jgi:phosphatidylglycerol:prolipoprotein diacylglycerol transferase